MPASVDVIADSDSDVAEVVDITVDSILVCIDPCSPPLYPLIYLTTCFKVTMRMKFLGANLELEGGTGYWLFNTLENPYRPY